METLIYALEALNVHNGDRSSGANYAIFRTAGSDKRAGEFQLHYQDWVHRGRPTEITVTLPTG